MSYRFWTFLLIMFGQSIRADYRIVFFIQEYPALSNVIDIHATLKEKTQLAKQTIITAHQQSRPIGGLFVTYAGYLAMSDYMTGQISFPRKQQKTSFRIIVTQHIEPIIMLGKTVHHWQLIKGIPASAYLIERKQDSDTQLYYWQTSKTTLPDNGAVPLDALVIFAKPQEIYIPLGITPTNNNPQLILPFIYTKKEIDLLADSLLMLKVNHFFRAIRSMYKPGTDYSWSSQIEE